MKLLPIIILSVIFSSCAVQVKSVYDPEVDFEKYNTFCWLESCNFTYTGPSYLNDSLLREQIKDAIIEELKEKGLNQEEDNPDLLIDFHISMEQGTMEFIHEDFENDIDGLFAEGEVEYRDFLKGTLIIDIVDRQNSKMIWRSAAIRYMDVNPEITKGNIHNGISRALKDFPPKQIR